MKLREIYFRELVNCNLSQNEYPFTSEEESTWELKELGEYLFPNMSIEVSENWVTTYEIDNDDERDEESKREYKFPQF